jgi:coenzyme F420-reducing hydrogenase beta subunit
MVAGNPPRPVARLARNVEDIRQEQKSKYCPVPILTILQ